MEFRDLNKNDIECRIATVKSNGISLLLYKNARVDMAILDETVGVFGWQREHKELKGNIYCGISILNPTNNLWVTKWDCGKESYSESEKGEASDSFKRAGFNWGIGRELYTAPYIWIEGKFCEIKDSGRKDNFNNPIYTCNDRFVVSHIKIKDKQIVELEITHQKTGVVCFKMKPKVEQESYDPNTPVTDIQAKSMYKALLKKLGSNEEVINYIDSKYGIDNTSKLTVGQYVEIAEEMKQR